MLGIDKAKGSIEVGKQADIVVFDPTYKDIIKKEDIYSRFDEVSIYKNKTLQGKVHATFLRGHQIYNTSEPSILNS